MRLSLPMPRCVSSSQQIIRPSRQSVYVEVLGFHRLAPEDQQLFRRFFASAELLHVTPSVLERAVILRQQRRMSFGDSLIAGTALVHNRVLLTRNLDDFRWIAGLQLLDPMVTPNP
jgi:predicted nucleic acid-binding protein